MDEQEQLKALLETATTATQLHDLERQFQLMKTTHKFINGRWEGKSAFDINLVALGNQMNTTIASMSPKQFKKQQEGRTPAVWSRRINLEGREEMWNGNWWVVMSKGNEHSLIMDFIGETSQDPMITNEEVLKAMQGHEYNGSQWQYFGEGEKMGVSLSGDYYNASNLVTTIGVKNGRTMLKICGQSGIAVAKANKDYIVAQLEKAETLKEFLKKADADKFLGDNPDDYEHGRTLGNTCQYWGQSVEGGLALYDRTHTKKGAAKPTVIPGQLGASTVCTQCGSMLTSDTISIQKHIDEKHTGAYNVEGFLAANPHILVDDSGVEAQQKEEKKAKEKVVAKEVTVQAESKQFIPNKVEHFIFNKTQKEKIQIFLNRDKPFILSGPRGCGKSTVIQEICHETQRPLLRISMFPEMDMDVVIGRWIVDENRTMVWQDGILPQAMRAGAILLVDEMFKASSNILLAFQSVNDSGYLHIGETNERLIATEGFQIVGASNSNGLGDETGNYVSENVVDTSIPDRGLAMLECDYPSPAVEKRIVKANVPNIEEEHVAKLINLAKAIRNARNKEEVMFDFSLRRSIACAMMIEDYTKHNIGADPVLEAIKDTISNMAGGSDKVVIDEIAQRVFGQSAEENPIPEAI